MKRKFLLLVALLLLLSGCREAMTPEKLMDEAMQNMESMDTVSARVEISVNLDDGADRLEIPVVMDIRATGLQGTDPRVGGELSVAPSGVETRMQFYQEGEWSYLVAGGESYKIRSTEISGFADVSEMWNPLPEELLKSAEVQLEGDGMKMRIHIPDEQFAALYGSLGTSVDALVGGSGGELRITDAVLNIAVTGGYVRQMNLSFQMNEVAEGRNLSAEVTADMELRDPGTAVELTPPAGYTDFPEIGIG